MTSLKTSFFCKCVLYCGYIGNIETMLRIYVSKMFSLIFLLCGIFTFRRFNISTFLFFGIYIFYIFNFDIFSFDIIRFRCFYLSTFLVSTLLASTFVASTFLLSALLVGIRFFTPRKEKLILI